MKPGLYNNKNSVNMKNSVLKVLMTLFFLGINVMVNAQPGGGPNNPSPLRDDPNADIDSALLWLFAAGTVLGTYIVFKRHKKVVK